MLKSLELVPVISRETTFGRPLPAASILSGVALINSLRLIDPLLVFVKELLSRTGTTVTLFVFDPTMTTPRRSSFSFTMSPRSIPPAGMAVFAGVRRLAESATTFSSSSPTMYGILS